MKPTILIFIDWFSPGYKAGGPVTSNINMMAHIKDAFRFLVVTRNTDYTDNIPYPDILADQWISRGDFEGYYISCNNLTYKIIRKLIRETPCDTVYINGIYSWYFSILPLWLARKAGRQVVVSSRGMLSAHALGVKTLKKGLFVKLARILGWYNGVHFHATNNEEASAIRSLLGKDIRVSVAPNLPRPAPGTFPSREKNPGFLHLVGIARISPEKNTRFALEVLKALSIAWNTLPVDQEQAVNRANVMGTDWQIIFDLYGPVYDQEYWRLCKETIAELPVNVRVNHRGSAAPEICTKVLQEAHFLFMPTRGENFGHAILEALQQACPVIISDATPWRDLQNITMPLDEAAGVKMAERSDVSPHYAIGWDLSLEHKEDFVKVLQQGLQMGQEAYSQMSRQAFDYAAKVSSLGDRLEANRKLFD